MTRFTIKELNSPTSVERMKRIGARLREIATLEGKTKAQVLDEMTAAAEISTQAMADYLNKGES